MNQTPTHVAFMDDTRLSERQGYKSAALITMSLDAYAHLMRDMEDVVARYRSFGIAGPKPMHFKDLNSIESAERYFQVLQHFVEYLSRLGGRVDVMTWDETTRNRSAGFKQDNAHKVSKLLNRVMKGRWGNGVWSLHPDRDSPLDWALVSMSHLDVIAREEVISKEELVVQICDLMCGMANFFCRCTNAQTAGEIAKMELVKRFCGYIEFKYPGWKLVRHEERGIVTPYEGRHAPLNFWTYRGTLLRGERPAVVPKRLSRSVEKMPGWMLFE